MHTRKIFTIGDFATLRGNEIIDLPLISPKISHTQEMLEKYERRLIARKKGTFLVFKVTVTN